MKFSTIFLDMDGVLSNFHLEAVRSHIKAGRRLPHIFQGDNPLQLKNDLLNRGWPRGLSLQKYMGEVTNGKPKDLEAFWEPIRRDPRFWHLIPPYDNYKEVVKLCETYAHEVVITTSADWTPDSHSGKRAWLVQHDLGRLEHITIRKKWRLADPTCLLIDDFEDHIKGWRRTLRKRWGIEGTVIPPSDKVDPVPLGCHAILYPQPWNANHEHMDQQLAYVEQRIKFYLEPRRDYRPPTGEDSVLVRRESGVPSGEGETGNGGQSVQGTEQRSKTS